MREARQRRKNSLVLIAGAIYLLGEVMRGLQREVWRLRSCEGRPMRAAIKL